VILVFNFILPTTEAESRKRHGAQALVQEYVEDFAVIPPQGSTVTGDWDADHWVSGIAGPPTFDVRTPTLAEGHHEVSIRVDVYQIGFADPDETVDGYRSPHRDCRICFPSAVDSPA
jgi:hypothetical protein